MISRHGREWMVLYCADLRDLEEYVQARDGVTGWITEHNTDAALREGHD